MRSIKTLGLAVVAALALMAFAGAGTASAKSMFINPEGGTTKVSGSITGEKKQHELRLGTETFKCSAVSFSGGELSGEVSGSTTVSPELGNCEWQPPFSYSWKMNGCKFYLRAGYGAPESGTSTSWVDIVDCKPAMSIASAPFCEVTIGNQNGIGTVQLTNVKPGTPESTIKMAADLSGITYTRSAGCPGSAGTFTNGTYKGEWMMKGSSKENEAWQKPIRLEPGEGTASFATEEVPASISGASTGLRAVFTISGNGNVACDSRSLNGGVMTGLTTGTFITTATYSACEFAGFSGATISMGACSFELDKDGDVRIVGESCASNPITVTASAAGNPTYKCVATIGPQSLTGLTYSSGGSGKTRTVTKSGATNGLTATSTGIGCPNPGTTSNGKYRDEEILKTTNSKGEQRGFWLE